MIAGLGLLNAGPVSAAEPLSREGRLAHQQVAISSIINDADSSEFRLRYGTGEISVELAGWERLRPAEAAPVMRIGEPRHRGRRRGVFSRAHLDAQRSMSRIAATWSRDGNEPWQIRAMPVPPLYGGRPISIRLAGRVVKVGEHAFALEVEAASVQIDPGDMIDSPLDRIGSPAVEVGDWVQVGGTLDDAFFRERRLEAHRVTRIVGDEIDAS